MAWLAAAAERVRGARKMDSRDSRAYGTFARQLRDKSSRIYWLRGEMDGNRRLRAGPSWAVGATRRLSESIRPAGGERAAYCAIECEGAMEEFLDRFDREV